MNTQEGLRVIAENSQIIERELINALSGIISLVNQARMDDGEDLIPGLMLIRSKIEKVLTNIKNINEITGILKNNA